MTSTINPLCKLLFYGFILADLPLGAVPASIADKKIISQINSLNASWTAGVNRVSFPKKFESSSDREKFGVRPALPPTLNFRNTTYPPILPNEVEPLVRSFDARTHWPSCLPILSRIRDQGLCGSGWAVATASMLSDRVCIQSNATMMSHLSAHELMTCANTDSFGIKRPPCEGGSIINAVQYFFLQGLVTGGEVDTNEGCKPYVVEYYHAIGNEECVEHCADDNYYRGYYQDKVEPAQRDFGCVFPSTEEEIRREIYNHGPVVAEIIVYDDLLFYRSGVYTHKLGAKLGYHWIKLIGWGDQDDEMFWIAVNSHGKKFGYGGTMRFTRGVNHCGVEKSVVGTKDFALTRSPFYRQAAIHTHDDESSSSVISYQIFLVCLLLSVYMVRDTNL